MLTTSTLEAGAGAAGLMPPRPRKSPGIMLAAERRMARTPYIPDLLIATTAKVYGMEIATLNWKHFEHLGVPLVDL
jgi:hypothetical protein